MAADIADVEGHVHRNVAVKYLMKRRRSVLMTKNPEKVEKLFSDLPTTIKIVGKQVTKEYRVRWQREGTEDTYAGSRFVFTMAEVGAPSSSSLEKPQEQ